MAGYCNLFHKTLHKQTCACTSDLTSEKVVSTNHFCYKRPDCAQLVAANPICSSSVWRAGESQWPVQCWAGLGWAGGCKLVQVQLRHRRGEVASVASNHQQLPGEHRHLARAEPDPRHHGQVLRREVLEREEALQVRAGHLLQQAGPADLPLAHGPRSGEQTNRWLLNLATSIITLSSS